MFWLQLMFKLYHSAMPTSKKTTAETDVLIAETPNAAWVYRKLHVKRIETFDNKSQKIITCISEIDLHQYSLIVLLLFLVMV